MKTYKLGYVRLCDAAPLIVAHGLGFYTQEALRVELVPLSSWSELRDRLIVDDIQAAHCLAGIPLAAQAGLFGPNAQLATAFTLNHHGNAITLARPLAEILFSGGVAAFAALVRERRASGRPLVMASVFPVSRHEYELRHWVRSLGLNPETDLRLVVVPQPETAGALRSSRIDGYCVGEPWNTRAQLEGSGVIVATSAALGLPGTEKVLALREARLEDEGHAALLRALARAADWLSERANSEAALELLAPYIGRPLRELRPALCGSLRAHDEAEGAAGGGLQFGRAVNRPDAAHACWYLKQMQAARQLDGTAPVAQISARAFRADLYDRLFPN
jgi:two-component system, oxyanion-binding sensor